ncbi:hypothetical protein FKM82_019411 [Ascaphus truei]
MTVLHLSIILMVTITPVTIHIFCCSIISTRLVSVYFLNTSVGKVTITFHFSIRIFVKLFPIILSVIFVFVHPVGITKVRFSNRSIARVHISVVRI